jgi:diaminohydroxyphosphoribosylaminopyrimidine deaminase/5-amino-6-(5-phosphoribosylamino)uracil reductase
MLMDDAGAMAHAIEHAAGVRSRTSANPWVGAVVVDATGRVVGVGATEPVGGAHAEVIAIEAAGAAAVGATMVVTLEPCSHHGRTPPCVDAIVAAGIARVVVGVHDPDRRVAGLGVAGLRAAGVAVEVGLLGDQVTAQREPYLHHRRTGRPYVVCKLATTLDGGIAAPDGSSRWITGQEARTDAHRLRAESDAIIVGAATIRADDPSLTVRHVEGTDPFRVVLGRAPAAARVHPCLEWTGDIPALLDELGRRDIVQVMIECGSAVVRSFHDATGRRC